MWGITAFTDGVCTFLPLDRPRAHRLPASETALGLTLLDEERVHGGVRDVRLGLHLERAPPLGHIVVGEGHGRLPMRLVEGFSRGGSRVAGAGIRRGRRHVLGGHRPVDTSAKAESRRWSRGAKAALGAAEGEITLCVQTVFG